MSMEDRICEIKKQLLNEFENDMRNQSISYADADHAANAIHHLAETSYYDKVTEAMDDANERYGYNNNRASNGRYMSGNSGNQNGNYGYRPMVDQNPYLDMYLNDRNGMNADSEYGRAYDKYQTAKRHFTQTKSVTDRDEMNQYSSEHLSNAIYTLKEMWRDADPTMRQKMKTELSAVVEEMKV